MKKLTALVIAMLLLCTLALPAFALPENGSYIYDTAELLTPDEVSELNKSLVAFEQQYGVGLYFVTKQGFADESIQDFAEKYCADNSLGVNNETSGMLCVLDLDSDSHLFYTYGNGGDYFIESATDRMFESFSEKYTQGDYCGMYSAMLSDAETYVIKTVTTPGYGADYDYSAPDSGGKYVIDDADLFTDSEEAALLERVTALREKYSFDIVLLTVNSIGSKSVVDFADDYYDYNGYGYGENRDGLLFMLNMGGRDYYTSTRGYGLTAFTDYAIDSDGGVINEAIVSDLSDGNYYDAFNAYLDLADTFLAKSSEGTPYDVGNTYRTASDIISAEIFVIISSLFAGFVVALLLKKGMNTAIRKHAAGDYIVPGSLVITNSNDVFTGTTMSKTPKAPPPSSSGGSGGGSSSHTSSSGASHGGGGGKF